MNFIRVKESGSREGEYLVYNFFRMIGVIRNDGTGFTSLKVQQLLHKLSISDPFDLVVKYFTI